MEGNRGEWGGMKESGGKWGEPGGEWGEMEENG